MVPPAGTLSDVLACVNNFPRDQRHTSTQSSFQITMSYRCPVENANTAGVLPAFLIVSVKSTVLPASVALLGTAAE